MYVPSPSGSTVALVPWDAESQAHVDRLTQQRIDCGWDTTKPAGAWREAQREGAKCIFWLVLPQQDDDAREKLKLHTSAHPKQSSPLLDTCTKMRGVPLEPSSEEFVPVGHIALDMAYPATDQFNLGVPAESSIWIKSLFISLALQSCGLGRAAMDTLESMATSKPLSATTLMLDTMEKEDQIMLKNPKMNNQDWYERRGYRIIHTTLGFYDLSEVPEAKKFPGFVAKTVFMRKDLE